MLITVGEKEYELSTKLKVAMDLEKKFKLPMTQLFGKIEVADITELISMLAIAAAKSDDVNFRNELLENLDYIDLQTEVQGLLANIMFSGTQEQIESKIEKFPAGEDQKNVLRGMLGIPQIHSTGNESPESGT